MLTTLAATSAWGQAPPSVSTVQLREGVLHPNVVLVLVDDLDETGGPYWKAMPKTRALIASRGVTFRNAFATDPVCCPARATILTGMYPHNTGVWSAYSESVGGAELKTVAVRMREAGYSTAFVGKYLNGYERAADRVPPGWDEWFGLAGEFLDGYHYQANHNGTIEDYGGKRQDYQTDVLARVAASFVERTEADDAKPFLLVVSPSAPHAPLKPAPRHAENGFADDQSPRRANFDEADVSDKPLWLREGVPRLDAAALAKVNDRYQRAMGSLLAVDDMVETIATRLRANGDLDSTVFVFTSDNGLNRGAHRLLHKSTPYEESIRVPLAVAGPEIRRGSDDRFVTHADLAPTLLDLIGVPVPEDIDGRSMATLLRTDKGRGQTELLVEYRQTLLHTLPDVRSALARDELRFLVPTYRALRSQEWLYVEWYGGDEHEYELYDMKADPYQLSNLLATPEGLTEYRTTADKLQARLEELAMCAGAACG